MDSPLPYSEVEFNETPRDQLDKFRVELTIRNGFRRLPSDDELMVWARKEYGQYVPDIPGDGYLEKAFHLGVYLDFYPEIIATDVRQGAAGLMSRLYVGHWIEDPLHVDYIPCHVGPEAGEHGLAMMRGMWLADNDPLAIKAIVNNYAQPDTVNDWWNWRPPTN